jgi:Tfp pilus assembly protein FimT
MRQYKQCGFTYIETLMVVGLLSIVLTFGMRMGIDSIGRSSVYQERDLIVSLLLIGARSNAMANIGNSAYGVHIDSAQKQYVLFGGDSYIDGAPENRVIDFTSNHLSVAHTGGADIVFAPLSGDVVIGVGTITISGGGVTQSIRLNRVGQIDW